MMRCVLRSVHPLAMFTETLLTAAPWALFFPLCRRLADEDDELSEVQPDAVPPEVREWLASTFTRQLATTRRKADEKPKFRSVAHAIRAGIFVDRIYRRVSNTALMQFPPDVVRVLKVSSDITTDSAGLLCSPGIEIESMPTSCEGSSSFESGFPSVSNNDYAVGCGEWLSEQTFLRFWIVKSNVLFAFASSSTRSDFSQRIHSVVVRSFVRSFVVRWLREYASNRSEIAFQFVSMRIITSSTRRIYFTFQTLDEWSFDVFALSDSASSQPVKYLGYDLLNRYGMIHKFKVPPVTLETFLTRVEEGYCRHKNPYHNNLHAADVAQTVHYMLCQTGLMNWLTDLEIFATLVAALIHDYEHTGTTNNFHVMSGTETALLYNDRAVLENHHISASFRVIKDDECNILQNLSREEFREFRTLVIDMVLATDMSFHFQQLKNMKNLLTLAEPSVDKSKALSLVLHCCDISHPAKRWDLHHRWTMLLLEEFFRQGDMERDLGLPFSPLCDRNNTLVAESQIGFIEFIVEPSMAVCSDMLEAILGPIHSSCKPSDSARESISEDAELDRTKNGISLNYLSFFLTAT
ncbi:hypothetical protein ANN_11827 [Periplaneta americana]|uniref:Phosphodiesterase n=1 Tax=Periplaneta americana TaxID=6978 RepID=A0ABQ8T7M0_PERAM|nr:hypothetical protein ANN_11827 [Periplaneta americana]